MTYRLGQIIFFKGSLKGPRKTTSWELNYSQAIIKFHIYLRYVETRIAVLPSKAMFFCTLLKKLKYNKNTTTPITFA